MEGEHSADEHPESSSIGTETERDDVAGNDAADLEFIENKNSRDPDEIKCKYFILTKADDSLGYKFPLYYRCELKEPMNSLTFFNGDVVERPAGTVFRPGQEVFFMPSPESESNGEKVHPSRDFPF